MPTSTCPSGRLGPPLTTMGQGKEMRRVPCVPRDFKTMSHTAERCRCRPSGPDGTFWVQAGSGCLAARVTRSRGELGVGLAQVVAGRNGHDHLARHMPRTGAGLATGACRTSRAPRALTARTAGLARGPSTTGASGPVATGASGRSPCSSGNRARGWYLRRVWCRMSGDHAKNGTYRRGEVCRAEIEKGGVDMKQCNNKTKKLDEIHRNSYQNSYEIRTKFVGISYEFDIARIFLCLRRHHL